MSRILPCMNIACATGMIQSIKEEGGGVMSFELWGEVMEALDQNQRIRLLDDSGKFYLISKIYIYREFLEGGNVDRLLEEDRFVSTVYKSFKRQDSGEFIEVLLKMEEPNVSKDLFMVEHLSRSMNVKPTPERF